MMSAPTPDHQKNIELMRRMNSPNGSDPIPPSQYLYFLDDPNRVQRVVAWVRSKTIRQNHRSPFAVDQNQRALTLSHLAADCFNGNLGNASNTWKAAESQKLVAKDEQGRLCLCGNVPSRNSQQKQHDRDEDVVCTENQVLRTNNQLRQFEALPAEDRERFQAACPRFAQWRDAVMADAVAAARAHIEQQERLFLEGFGLPRQNGKKKRDLSDKPLCVQLTLLAVPNLNVQTNRSSVRAANPTVYSGENGHVHSQNGGASINTEVQRTTTTEEGSSSSSADLCSTPETKAEEEDPPPTFASLKAMFPRARFDEGKSKPIFDGLTLAERARVIQRLAVYLSSARWVKSLAENQGQWIPFCSKWLNSYDAGPPPVFNPYNSATQKLQNQADSIKQSIKFSRLFRGESAGGVR
jgi:hypothetical protein